MPPPFLGLLALMLLALLATYVASRAFRRKVLMAAVGAQHMLLSKDRKFEKAGPKRDVSAEAGVRKKHLVFIRHGESEWNVVFNPKATKDDPSALMPHVILARFLKALVSEVLMLATNNSFALDSPLSARGVAQADNLATYIESPDKCLLHLNNGGDHDDHALHLLKGVLQLDASAPTSVIACSNLRRCMLTALVSLRSRLCPPGRAAPKERVHVTTSLQEMSRNVDCVAFALEPETMPPSLGHALKPKTLSPKGASQMHEPGPLDRYFDVSGSKGNKPLRGAASNGRARMEAFARWAVQRDEEVVIAVGHSLYFREFFSIFTMDADRNDPLTYANLSRACKNKMINCGMVGLTIAHDEVNDTFQIVPDSVRVLKGGFEASKSSYIKRMKPH